MTKLKDSRCPKCDYLTNATESIHKDAPPKPGDFCLCLNCGAALKFGPGLSLEIPRDIELIFYLFSSPASYKKFRQYQELILKRGPIKKP